MKVKFMKEQNQFVQFLSIPFLHRESPSLSPGQEGYNFSLDLDVFALEFIEM